MKGKTNLEVMQVLQRIMAMVANFCALSFPIYVIFSQCISPTTFLSLLGEERSHWRQYLHAGASAPSCCLSIWHPGIQLETLDRCHSKEVLSALPEWIILSLMMAPSLAMYDTLLACLFSVVAYLIYQSLTSPNTRYPPGPRPYPFIGNLLDVPTSYQEKAFANLAKIYGMSSH